MGSLLSSPLTTFYAPSITHSFFIFHIDRYRFTNSHNKELIYEIMKNLCRYCPASLIGWCYPPVQSMNNDLNASLATADELSREFNSMMHEVTPSPPQPGYLVHTHTHTRTYSVHAEQTVVYTYSSTVSSSANRHIFRTPVEQKTHPSLRHPNKRTLLWPLSLDLCLYSECECVCLCVLCWIAVVCIFTSENFTSNRCEHTNQALENARDTLF